jgi:hypothetical protein
MPANLAVALLHYPVYNKHREVVTTAFTNLDIHDIARTCRTFGLSRYFLVTPSIEQQQLIQRIVTHWDSGWGADYNPDRREALSIVRSVQSLDDAIIDLQQSGQLPVSIIVTGAANRSNTVSFVRLRQMLQDKERQYLLLLGTGWGLADELFEQADTILEPIQGVGTYNHLPVRSALAIMLDRLLGTY